MLFSKSVDIVNLGNIGLEAAILGMGVYAKGIFLFLELDYIVALPYM